MIRLAFLGVFLLAGALAFGAFSLMRNSGGPAPIAVAVEAAEPVPEVIPVEKPPEDERFYFLADQDLDVGQLALVLYRADASGNSVVVTDVDALKAAQETAYVNVKATGVELAGSTLLTVMGVPPEQRIAALFRGDEMVLELRCGSTTCDDFTASEDSDFADLVGASQPLTRIHEE